MTSESSPLDVASVRRLFPALDANPDFVFADNAGGTQVLGSVVERISEYLLQTNVQMADYGYSHRAATAVASGKAAAAVFAGTTPEQVMIGASATQLFETLSRMIEATVLAQRREASTSQRGQDNSAPALDASYAAPSIPWNEGDEMIISAADHEANRGAWIRLARSLGLRLVEWPVTRLSSSSKDQEAMHVGLDAHVLASLVTPRTRLVAFTASSNVLGSHWTDAQFAEMCRAVKEKSKNGAYICVDAVAFAPHRRLRPEQWSVDFVVWSWYKVFGPHVGSMYVSTHAKDTLLSKLNHHFLHGIEGSMYPYQPSSEQYELIASIAAVVDYLVYVGRAGENSTTKQNVPRCDYAGVMTSSHNDEARKELDRALDVCYERFSRHEEALARQVLAFLDDTKGQLAVLGDPTAHQERAPTVAFAPQDVTAATARLTSKALHKRVVASGHLGAQVGHMYAHALIASVPGLDVDGDGVMRVSFVHYNTPTEVETMCAAIKKALDTQNASS